MRLEARHDRVDDGPPGMAIVVLEGIGKRACHHLVAGTSNKFRLPSDIT